MSTNTVYPIGIVLAAQKQKDQRRKSASASPYFNHPLEAFLRLGSDMS